MRKLILPRANWIPQSRPFSGRSNLEEASLPLIKALPYECFNSCTKLKTLDVPLVTEIGAAALAGTGLEEFTIKSQVTKIERQILAKCPNLKKVTIEYNETPLVTEYTRYSGDRDDKGNQMMFANSPVETLVIDRDLEIVSANYNQSVSFTNERAASLKTVIIGENVRSLNGYSFNNDQVLKTFRCHSTVPVELKALTYPEDQSRGNFVSTKIQAAAWLDVPTAAIEAYQAAPVWKGFKCIEADRDINSDDNVDVGDINVLLADILDDGSNLNYDMNGDGVIDVGDVNAILTRILEY